MGREASSVGMLHGPQWADHMGKVPAGGLTPVSRRGLGVKGGTKSSLQPHPSLRHQLNNPTASLK